MSPDVDIFDEQSPWFKTWRSPAALVVGDALSVTQSLPDSSIDMVMTSPPYWKQRQYDGGGIGQEKTPDQYLRCLLDVFGQVQRVLRPTGSFWLNVGDTY
ncbi:DNA methyltransferase, partial [uncultured Actinomyces sp.]